MHATCLKKNGGGMYKMIWVFALSLLALFSQPLCASNPARALPTYSVGDFALGGVVFWVDPSRQHGLVCSIEDQSTGAAWMGAPATGIPLGTMANGVWMGAPNTQAITSFITEFSIAGVLAAALCSNYRGGGYSDWYLPSANEAVLFYLLSQAINQVFVAHGGTPINQVEPYWTSTEVDDSHSYVMNGSLDSALKTDLCYVRAVRAF